MDKTFDVSGEGLYQHKIGNKNCNEGYCDGLGGQHSGYPCQCQCGGLIHADFGDYDSYDSYWLYKKCDKCGDNFEEKEGG